MSPTTKRGASPSSTPGSSTGSPAISTRVAFHDDPAPWRGRRDTREEHRAHASWERTNTGEAPLPRSTLGSMEPEEYGRIAAAETGHWWYRNTRALVAELLAPHLRSGITVLDAGCGPGGNGAWLGSLGTVVGLDREMNALSYVAERHAATRPVRGTVAALPFADATFDVVLSLT